MKIKVWKKTYSAFCLNLYILGRYILLTAHRFWSDSLPSNRECSPFIVVKKDKGLKPPPHCVLFLLVPPVLFFCLLPPLPFIYLFFSSVQFLSVVSGSLQPHRLQHTTLLCPSPTPRACSNSCPLSW